MATQPPAPPPGNGRESLSLSLGGKSIGIQAGNLIPILLLILLGVGGFLLWTATDHRLEAILTGQAQLQAISTANKETVIEALHTMQEFLTAQVRESQQRIISRDQANQARGQEALEVIQKMLRTHEWNNHQPPEGRLPLDLPTDIIGGGKPLRPGGPP